MMHLPIAGTSQESRGAPSQVVVIRRKAGRPRSPGTPGTPGTPGLSRRRWRDGNRPALDIRPGHGTPGHFEASGELAHAHPGVFRSGPERHRDRGERLGTRGLAFGPGMTSLTEREIGNRR